MKDDLREVVKGTIGSVELVSKVFADKKLNAADLPTLFTELPGVAADVVSAIKDIDNVKIADLDTEEERAELLAFVKQELDLPNDTAEELIEEFVDTILSFINSGVKAVNVYRKLKPAT